VAALVQVQVDAHPLVDEVQLADLAHRDAAVGDLGVGEDAAGVGEIGADGAALRADDALRQADVLSADVGDPDEGDDHEQDQADLRGSGQHGRITRPRPG